jgi:SAM-dependent methyltransferase
MTAARLRTTSPVDVARRVRYRTYEALAPADYLFRVASHLRHYPPLHLRAHVGGMSAGLNGPGYEFVAHLRHLAGLREDDRVWDVGCGCGLLELALEDLGWQGRLTGTDIHWPSVDWAASHISRRCPGFSFVHMDVYNAAYWPGGTLTARQGLERFPEAGFDVAIAKSLFTHVLPDELDIYLSDIAGRLAPGGRALLTFFVLSEEQQRLAAAGRNRLSFAASRDGGRWAVRRPQAPTAAVAYRRDVLEERLEAAGFDLQRSEIHPGTWSGDAGGLSYQDIVLARK